MKRKWLLTIGCAALLSLSGCGSDAPEAPVVETLVPEKLIVATPEPVPETVVAEEPESTEEEEIPEEILPVSITISAAGDVTMGNYDGQGYTWTFAEMWDTVQNPAYFFENVLPIFENDDMTIVNLEGPLATGGRHKEKTYSICGLPEYVTALTEGSVEAVNMANNHHLDRYEEGNAETIQTVEGAGIVYTQEYKVGIFETKGIRIGLVSADSISLGAGAEKVLKQGIEELQNEGVDLIIANCHWGIEREYYPNDWQQKLGKKLIDLGCDLVLGHHPHVIQGIEEYQGKYIVYSLGNFCFGANKNPSDKDCIIFQQTFTFLEGVKQEEAPAKIIPCSISSVTTRNDFKPTPAEGDYGVKILDRMRKYSENLHVDYDDQGNLLSKQP